MEKLFEETDYHYEEYAADACTQEMIHKDEENICEHPGIYEMQKKWFRDRKEVVYATFKREHDSYSKKNVYFYGCSFLSYKNTFDERLKSHIKEYSENSIISFIDSELKPSKKPYEDFWLSKKILNNIETSLRLRREFLLEKAGVNGYEIVNNNNAFKLSKINYPKTLDNEEVLVDLSETNIKQKIIYLHELGLLQELRKAEPFNLSVNRIAQVVGAITGENQRTIQSYINPIFHTSSDKIKSALYNQADVEKVRYNLLNSVGFEIKK